VGDSPTATSCTSRHWYSPPVMTLADKCQLSLAVQIEEISINHHILSPSNTSPSLNVHIQLESNWHEGIKERRDAMAKPQQFSVALSAVNGNRSCANAVLIVLSEMALTRRKLHDC